MPKITELYAVIDETDGIVAMRIGDVWMPFVFSTLTEAKIKQARLIATQAGKPFTLAKFTVREDIETILP